MTIRKDDHVKVLQRKDKKRESEQMKGNRRKEG